MSVSATSASRRRQRSTRLTVAVGLLVLAAVLVAGAVVSGVGLLVVIAAALGVLLGAAATRITHSELMASRREAARDRAEQAKAYATLDEERNAENRVHEAHLAGLMAASERTVADLEAALAAAHQRAAAAIRARAAEASRAETAEADNLALAARLEEADARAAEAIVRVAELEAEIDVVRAELEAARAQYQTARSA